VTVKVDADENWAHDTKPLQGAVPHLHGGAAEPGDGQRDREHGECERFCNPGWGQDTVRAKSGGGGEHRKVKLGLAQQTILCPVTFFPYTCRLCLI
jgi:hypothetical protein